MTLSGGWDGVVATPFGVVGSWEAVVVTSPVALHPVHTTGASRNIG